MNRTRKSSLLATAITLAMMGPAQAQAPAITDQLGKEIDALVAKNYAQMETLYKDIHATPEIAFQEINTAKKLAKEMRDLGFEVTEGVGKTGVVAMLKNGAGPTIMVRTELDALPMEEKTGLPYASKVKTTYNEKETFVAHSCGHDLHMASWVGTAKTLVALKSQWQGTLMFVAQPAEEAIAGAKTMMQDGLYTRFAKPNFAFALHTMPGLAGTVSLNSGPMTSNADSFNITFKGRGGHGSAPHRAIDPILIASKFIVDVQSVISRERDPFEFGVFSIGSIQGGSAANIIPDSVVLSGTIRSYKQEVRDKIHDGITRTAKAVAAMAGAPEPEFKIASGGEAVVNDVELVNRTEAVMKSAFGAAKVLRVPPITASEDFSEFINAGVPSMFFFIGTNDPKDLEASRQPGGKPIPFNHSPFFAPVPEPSIKTGVKAMSLAVLNALKK